MTALQSLILSKDSAWNTFQGEGPRLGRITTFLRLGGCNLTCTWCDTPYTWDWARYSPSEELDTVPIEEVGARLKPLLAKTASLTITGGEPLLQAKHLDPLFDRLHWDTVLGEVNFETNGTKTPPYFQVSGIKGLPINYVVSPKLANADTKPIVWSSLVELSNYSARFGEVDFKIVVESVRDLTEVEKLQKELISRGGYLPNRKIWIMPKGTSGLEQTKLARRLAEPVLERGWNLTTRYHLYIWGNERAR
jgi:organic radical activating enzyme